MQMNLQTTYNSCVGVNVMLRTRHRWEEAVAEEEEEED